VTLRTEHQQATPVEIATQEVLSTVSAAITVMHSQNKLTERQHITEKEFRRILALYFEQKTLADWCHDFEIPDATDPHDKPPHGREA